MAFSLSSHSFSSTARHLPPPPCVSFRHPRTVVSAYTATVQPEKTATSSFYEVLGLQYGATCQQIKAAYRRLAKVVHPDVSATSCSGDVADGGDDFKRVHQAYATLSDPCKRADYDRKLMVGRRRLGGSLYSVGGSGTTSYSRFSGYTRSTWETDQCW